jgi:hypothetical protein
MLNKGQDIEIEPYYCLPIGTQGESIPWSQPTSPTPPHARSYAGLMSPTHTNRLTYPTRKSEESKWLTGFVKFNEYFDTFDGLWSVTLDPKFKVSWINFRDLVENLGNFVLNLGDLELKFDQFFDEI